MPSAPRSSPADEAPQLALALGLDLERDIIRDMKLVAKKSGTVVLSKPADRRKKNMVDDDAESFPHLIDALHTAMMIYEEEGSKPARCLSTARAAHRQPNQSPRPGHD